MQLAVLAHIRHNFTSYDELLRQTSYSNARRLVQPICLDYLVKWRGDEETGRDQLDEILQEVIVISDSESDDDDSEDDDDDLSSDASIHLRDVRQGPLDGPFTVEESRSQYATVQNVSEATNLGPRPNGTYRRPVASLRRTQRGLEKYQAARDQAWQQAKERVGDRRLSAALTAPPEPLLVSQHPRLVHDESQSSRHYSRHESHHLSGVVDALDRENLAVDSMTRQSQSQAIPAFRHFHTKNGHDREAGSAVPYRPKPEVQLHSQTRMSFNRSGELLLPRTRFESPYEVRQVEDHHLRSFAARNASHSTRLATSGFVPDNGYEREFVAPRSTQQFSPPSTAKPVQQAEGYPGCPGSRVGSRWEVIQQPTNEYGGFPNTLGMPTHHVVHQLATGSVQDENAARQNVVRPRIGSDATLQQRRRMLQDAGNANLARQHFIELESEIEIKRTLSRDFEQGPSAHRYPVTRLPITRGQVLQDHDSVLHASSRRQLPPVRESSVEIILVRNKFPPRYEAPPVPHRLESQVWIL